MGTVLIKDWTLLPDVLQLESEPCATGWRLVKISIDRDWVKKSKKLDGPFSAWLVRSKEPSWVLTDKTLCAEGERNLIKSDIREIQLFGNYAR
jgi:hypothetical protein